MDGNNGGKGDATAGGDSGTNKGGHDAKFHIGGK
jgi:hypothetical protein